MHFADVWEDEDGDEWDDTYGDVKIDSPADAAHHHCKYAIVEDAFNARWKAAVIFWAAAHHGLKPNARLVSRPHHAGSRAKACPYWCKDAYGMRGRRVTCNIQVAC
jgi:hypothetical protein